MEDNLADQICYLEYEYDPSNNYYPGRKCRLLIYLDQQQIRVHDLQLPDEDIRLYTTNRVKKIINRDNEHIFALDTEGQVILVMIVESQHIVRNKVLNALWNNLPIHDIHVVSGICYVLTINNEVIALTSNDGELQVSPSSQCSLVVKDDQFVTHDNKIRICPFATYHHDQHLLTLSHTSYASVKIPGVISAIPKLHYGIESLLFLQVDGTLSITYPSLSIRSQILKTNIHSIHWISDALIAVQDNDGRISLADQVNITPTSIIITTHRRMVKSARNALRV